MLKRPDEPHDIPLVSSLDYASFLREQGIVLDSPQWKKALEVFEVLDIKKQYQEITALFKQATAAVIARRRSEGETSAIVIEDELIVLNLPGHGRCPIPTLPSIAKGIVANIDLYHEKLQAGFKTLSIAPLGLSLKEIYRLMSRFFRNQKKDISIVDQGDFENSTELVNVTGAGILPGSTSSWRVSLRQSMIGVPTPSPTETTSSHISNAQAFQIHTNGEEKMTLIEVLNMFLQGLSVDNPSSDVYHQVVALGTQYVGNNTQLKNPAMYFDPEDQGGPVLIVSGEDDSIAHPQGTAQTVVPILLKDVA